MGGLSAIDLLATVSVFMLVMCLAAIAGLLLLHKRNRRSQMVRQRVGMNAASQEEAEGRVVRLFRDGAEFEAVLPGLSGKAAGPLAKIHAKCRAAGIEKPLPTILLIAVASAVGTFALTFAFTGHLPGAIMASIGLLYGMWTLVRMKANKIAAKFDDQFVEALELCSRSLRAGHTVIAGLTLASEESHEPVKSVLTDIVQKQEMGVSLEDALREVASDHPSQDLKLFAASVAIQIRAGGNLAETTNRLAAVIRERLRLAKRVKVLIAQTQMSKQVLLGLPVVVFILLNVINPGYMEPMYQTDLGQKMIAICVASLVVGTWAMNKMAVLKY
jgi:Flp pilus assembly protein TadB